MLPFGIALLILPLFPTAEKSPKEKAAESAKYLACYDMCVESELGLLRECVGDSFSGVQRRVLEPGFTEKPYHPDDLKYVIRLLQSCLNIHGDGICFKACREKIQSEKG